MVNPYERYWFPKSKKVQWLLRYLYYKCGLRSFNCYETEKKYIAYINKKYVSWEKDLEYIKEYCKRRGIEVTTYDEGHSIYFKFEEA